MPGNINDIPLSVIKTWPPPNYIDPVTRPWLPILAGTLQGLATLMVGTRLILRFRNQAGGLGMDDLFLIPSFIFASLFTSLAIVGVTRFGNARHVWDVEPTELPTTMLIAWLSEITFLTGTCFTKVSTLLFYRRLSSAAISQRWKRFAITAIVVTCLYNFIFVMCLVFACTPIDAYWHGASPMYKKPYHCANIKALNPLAGTMSIVSDVYAVALPMGMMRHFEVARQRKIVLNLIFSLGLVVVGFGIARTYWLSKLGTGYDLTWIGFNVFVYSLFEFHLALICACAPALRVFFRQYIGKRISWVVRTAKSDSDGNPTAWSPQRDSFPLDSPSKVGYLPHGARQADIESCPLDEKERVGHNVTSIEPIIEEREYESRTSGSSDQRIRTPADFELYAMQNLKAG